MKDGMASMKYQWRQAGALANGEKCRKMEETQEIGVWVIGVMALNEEQVEWPWGGDSGAELAWPPWQNFNAQPPVWWAHSGGEAMDTDSRACGQMCVETPPDLNFPHTQWKSVITHKKHRANQAGWLWKLHTQLCRPGASSLLTNLPTSICLPQSLPNQHPNLITLSSLASQHTKPLLPDLSMPLKSFNIGPWPQ